MIQNSFIQSFLTKKNVGPQNFSVENNFELKKRLGQKNWFKIFLGQQNSVPKNLGTKHLRLKINFGHQYFRSEKKCES